MSDLFFLEQGTVLTRENERLKFMKYPDVLFEFELENVDSVCIFGNIHITTPLLKSFLKRNIPLAFFSIKGEFLGQLSPIFGKNIELRYLQYELSKEENFCLEFSKEIIQNKIRNSIHLLENLSKNRDDLNIKSDLNKLREWKKRMYSVKTLDELLGVEGSFSNQYFSVYKKFFKNPELFNGRSKRPPKDEGNATLSFLYTLVTIPFSHYIAGVGLDPFLGFYHKMDYGRVSLACDLVEFVRPLFCDRVNLKLFNYHDFSKQDFYQDEEETGGILLKESAKRKFFVLYTKEFYSEFDYKLKRMSLHKWMLEIIRWAKYCIQYKKVIEMQKFLND